MLIYKTGDLIKEVTTGIIYHGCNTQSKMNSGFAKNLRNEYPQTFIPYQKLLEKFGPVASLGKIAYHDVPNKELVIANAMTQLYYGREQNVRYVSYDAVAVSFEQLLEDHSKMDSTLDIHMPKIGCGLGGGDWEVISSIVTSALKHCEFKHRVFVWCL